MPDAGKPPRKRQMNVRLPPGLVDRIDARRERSGLSRDVFVERAMEYALRRPEATTTAPGKRTA